MERERLISDIDDALGMLAEPAIYEDLKAGYADGYINDLKRLKSALLSGEEDAFDETKITYFRGPHPYHDIYNAHTHDLFAKTLAILNGLSLYRIAQDQRKDNN